MLRPQFNEIKSYEEFSKFYWYREELQKICKQLGLDSSGFKADLNHSIEEYFNGNLVRSVKSHRLTERGKHYTKSVVTTHLTLQTSLLECRFCFNQRFRDFFSEQTRIKNFRFNVDMVATARKVKETNDTTFTLGDLLDIYYGKKTYKKYDKVSLQWNKFVQDFCADPAAYQFPNKLKTTARLWKIVRESTREKVFKHELLDEFENKI